MLNINDDTRDTVLVDLDGTLVIHNYDPENVEDVVIESTLKFLIRNREDYYIVLTTSRTLDHANLALNKLGESGFYPDSILYSLPTGRRVIINDHKEGEDDKAIAMNLVRNRGI